MIPQNFEQWRKCIEHDCGIRLTASFVHDRLRVFGDPSNPETIKFAQLYSTGHYQNVRSWLEKAKEILERQAV